MNFLDSMTGSPATLRTYKSLFKNHIEHYIPDEYAGEFTSADFVDEILPKWADLHPRSQKMLVHLLQKYVKFHGGNFEATPWVKALGQAIPLSKPKALSHEDLMKLLKECKKSDYELYEVAVCAAYTGMRRGEIFGLTWDNIDFKANIIMVYQSNDELVTKNRHPRVVQLPKKLKEVLQKRNSLTRASSAKVFRKFDPNDRLEVVCKRAGVPHISIHALRHTFATLALDARKSLKAVQTALGHKSVKTTIDIYWNKTQDIMNVDFI